MNSIYQYDGKNLIHKQEDGKEIKKYPSLEIFFKKEITPIMYMHLTEGDNIPIRLNKNKLMKIISSGLKKDFENLFKNKESITGKELDDFVEELESKYEKLGQNLDNEIIGFVYNNITDKILNENIGKIGGDMFKTIKEAKSFTAHLDSLANEIVALEGIAPEMKQHLAYRIDRLSDLIEVSALKEEKTAAIEKEAIGIGSGAWAYDEDEARYMSTFGGTGALKRDPDENYMDQFTADDHKEVLNRREPAEIKGDGQKIPQPSDNYNEAAVAQQLRSTIKSMVAAKLK